MGKEYSLGGYRPQKAVGTGRRRTLSPAAATGTGRVAAGWAREEDLSGSVDRVVVRLPDAPSEDRIAYRTVWLALLDDARYRFTTPVPVEIAEGDEAVTATAIDLESVGMGVSEFSALADLRRSIVEDYEMLAAKAEHLGPRPQLIWDRMRRIMEPIG